MIKLKFSIFYFVSLFLFVSSCNNEVFIKQDDLPDVTMLNLEPDGGEWRSYFSRSHLKEISLICPEEIQKEVRYYNKKGILLSSECNPSELASIVYDSPVRSFVINFTGDMIFIKSEYNSKDAYSALIRLAYDYNVSKVIDFTVDIGTPLEMVHFYRTGEVEVDEDYKTQTFSFSITNNSDKETTLEYDFGMRNVFKAEVMPSNVWAKGIVLDIPVLGYSGHEWVFYVFNGINIISGEIVNLPPYSYVGWQKNIFVPANSKTVVKYNVAYSKASCRGVMTLYNPVSGGQYEENIEWISIFPTSYRYPVE